MEAVATVKEKLAVRSAVYSMNRTLPMDNEGSKEVVQPLIGSVHF